MVRIPRFSAEYCVYEPSRAKVVGRNQANAANDKMCASLPGSRGIIGQVHQNRVLLNAAWLAV